MKILILKSKFLLVTVLFFLAVDSFSQGKYWVFFTDKNGVEFDPYQYFDPTAIQRRINQGLPIYDESDKPVKQEYLDQTSVFCDSMSYATRWFNGVAVYSDEARMEEVKKLPFVKEVRLMYEMEIVLAGSELDHNPGLRKLAQGQIKRMEGEKFAENKLTGKGIRIAIIDGGFKGLGAEEYEHDEFFNHVKIAATYDFIGKSENVYRKIQHGKAVLGCIAGKSDTFNLGLAPDAEFLLARTAKSFSEGTKDEECWLAAVEWCDKNGANIINTSLGYDVSKYFQSDMDGKTSLISRSANLAAKKGILVVVSAGNEGQNFWKKICTPADADSVLTVGALNPYSGIQCSWSSYGPSADFRLKPEVCAFGNVAAVYDNNIMEMMGTSFSAPLVAGFAACVMQLHPDWDCMKVKEEIRKSADLYPYFDYAHGNGVPQAGYFLNETKIENETFDLVYDTTDSMLKLIIKDEFFHYNVPLIHNYYDIGYFEGDDFDPEVTEYPSLHIYDNDMYTSASTMYTDMPNYLFYHVENNKGYLDKYFVVGIENKKVISLDPTYYEKGNVLRFYYMGYMKTYVIK